MSSMDTGENQAMSKKAARARRRARQQVETDGSVQAATNRLDTLESQNQNLRTKVHGLEKDRDAAQAQASAVRERMTAIEKTMSELVTQLRSPQNDVQALRNRLQAQEQKTRALEDTVKSLQDKLAQQEALVEGQGAALAAVGAQSAELTVQIQHVQDDLGQPSPASSADAEASIERMTGLQNSINAMEEQQQHFVTFEDMTDRIDTEMRSINARLQSSTDRLGHKQRLIVEEQRRFVTYDELDDYINDHIAAARITNSVSFARVQDEVGTLVRTQRPMAEDLPHLVTSDQLEARISGLHIRTDDPSEATRNWVAHYFVQRS